MEFNPSQPQSQTKVPPPPTPEVSIRTMQSDIQSISQGEINPMSEVIAPPPAVPNEPSFVPEVANQMIVDDGAAPHSSHKMLWTMIAIVVIIGLGAIGYFVVYPLLSGSDAAAPVTTPSIPEPVIPTPPPVAQHTSAFSNAVIQVPTTAATIAPLTRETILEALTIKATGLTEGITEVAFTDAQGGQIPFPAFLTALLPAFLDGQGANSYVADDFTAYLFVDKTGAWPGYVATLKPEGAATLNQWLTNLEKTDLTAFFLTAPGELSAFKTGTVKNLTDHFATGKTAGASFSYTVTDTQLIINTSFKGLQDGLALLGY